MFKTINRFLFSKGIINSMRIEANGIVIDARIDRNDRNNLIYKVVSQDEGVSDIIHEIGEIADEETGLKLDSNRRPNFHHDKRIFFVRGRDETRHNDEVVARFNSPQEAQGALFALENLINKVVKPERMKPDHPGGTTAVRMALITKSQANILSLSAKKHYPEQYEWPNQPVQPMVTENTHYNEHIGQVVDVLNKSKTNQQPVYEDGVINPHKVDSQAARWAVTKLRNVFTEAEQLGDSHLIAFWRLVTGLRAPDVKNEDNMNNGGPERNQVPPRNPENNRR